MQKKRGTSLYTNYPKGVVVKLVMIASQVVNKTVKFCVLPILILYIFIRYSQM